jgi:hypothetical protein
LDLGQLDETRKDQVLLAVTEQHAREDLDEFLAAVRSVLSH